MEQHPIGSALRPLRVAVIGAGPSGFYAVQALYRLSDVHCQADLFDRLPTPYGLVRGGVAPDHQSIKRVAAGYEKLGRDPRTRFFGHVTLGRDLLVHELRDRYDAIIYAVGNESDRKLGIPGEDLEGVHSATEFVYWYNAHPDYSDRSFDLEGAQRVVVIGNGNVAIDVARVLARPFEELAVTDISAQASAALARSQVKEIILLGRRGPAQSAFSPKEIKELAAAQGVDLVVTPRYVKLEPATEQWLNTQEVPRSTTETMEFLQAQAELGEGDQARKVRCWFRTSPVEFVGDEQGRLTHVRMVRNTMTLVDGRIKPVASEESWLEPAQLAFKAIGYRGVPIPGVPFDDWTGTVRNIDGRVTDEQGKHLPGEYVVGWAKRGPSGLIGTNRGDAKDTVQELWEDFQGRSAGPAPADDVAALLTARGVDWNCFEGWLDLDQAETARGEAAGKIREKFSTVPEMLQHLKG